MSGAGETDASQRWAPFPVQDWSTMPAMPATDREEVDLDPVDPGWGPPAPRRSVWPPLLVMLLVLALVGGAMYLADRRTGEPTSAALGYVPVDGSVAYQRHQVIGPRRTVRESIVTESARIVGSAAILSLDFSFGGQVYAALGNKPPTGHQFWRTTTTEIDSATASQQTVAVYRVDGDVVLLAASGLGIARTFTPGVVELPADVSAGDRWTGKGRAGVLDYATDFQADAAEDNCLRVTGTITMTTNAGQAADRRTEVKTWCPGTGIRSSTTTFNGVTISESPIAPPQAPRELRTMTDPYTWSDPVRWRTQTYDAMSIDPNYGEGVMPGVPGSAPPVVAASGLMIRTSSADDLIAFTPKTQTQWTSVWRMRPGGRVLTLTAFGDVLVVTTSRRQVVGYSDAGVRLWTRDLTEVAFRGPVRTTTTEAALVDAAGQLLVFDLRSGAPRWQAAVGAEVIAAPVATAGHVVIVDGAGTVHAYASADGKPSWTVDVEATRAVVLDDELILHNESTLMALSLSDGRYRWMEPTVGTVMDLQAWGDRVVLATRRGTTVYGHDGQVIVRRNSYLALTVNQTTLIGWGETQAEVLGDAGQVVATWDTPDQTNASGEIRALAGRNGVWRFTGSWQMTAWTDQP